MANVWTAYTNIPAGLRPDTMLLLTDGNVLVKDAFLSTITTEARNWYRLAPDAQGSYTAGTWTGPFPMINSRQFFASGILRDGRVFVIGGEYSDATAGGGTTSLGEIFDPQTNTWTALNKPATFSWISSDATGCTLADGRVLLGAPGSNRTALWDPDTDTWTEAGLAFGATTIPTKVSNTNEETWTLLPDGSVLTVQIVGSPATERYVPSTDQWVNAGNTLSTLPLVSLTDPVTTSVITIKEMGPALTLPDGRAFFVGGTGHTALYTPATNTWAAGQDLPADTSAGNFNSVNGSIQTAIDTPGVLLPNGNVLFVGGQTVREVSSTGAVSFWSNPCTVFLYDPVANTAITALTPQPPSNGVDAWRARLLLLPTGEVLFSSQQASVSILALDPPLATPNNAWRPAITDSPVAMVAGHSYVLTGTQFNGLSQACSYGDDAMVATNYPIVRVTHNTNNNVVYLRTSNFSSMGIATGATPQTVTVQVPGDIDTGQYSLVVIANGIASNAVTIQVAKQDCFFIVNRSTYGQGEIQAIINSSGTPVIIETALYIVAEGFKPNDLSLNSGNLNNPPVRPTIPAPVGGISFEFTGSVIPEDPSLPDSPQRFTYPFRIVFQDASMFNFGPTIETLGLTASLTSGGNTVSNVATIQLIKNPNPFILHGDIAHGYEWYLSTDVRVFQVKAGDTKFAAHVATSGTARTVATTFIQQALTNLNGSPGSAGSLFEALHQEEELTTLALAPTDTSGTPVYNFAVARVRYRDIISANNVRAHFRMWPAQQTNATYDPNTLYRSATNADGQRIPLLGVLGPEIMTIPFFATPRINTGSANMNTQTDTPNIRVINPDLIGGEVDTYFGCWLDINQPGDLLFPVRLVGPNAANLPDGPFSGMGALLPIQQLVRSEHQCLITEISFDPDPIPTNADPSNSDKLAQRNLTFVNVPNPGLIESRRAPQTFEIRPTPVFLPSSFQPDELMIEWGNTPAGSIANIYLPEALADDILAQANEMYATHRLSKADDYTIQCFAEGVTYIPVLRKAGSNFAGLLTVDLPGTVRKGQVYNITVKQVTTAILSRSQQYYTHQDANNRDKEFETGVNGKQQSFDWRRVLGVFQLTIPVSTRQALLAGEERRLSILRWIEQAIPVSDRWYLVFKRYVQQIANRVGDMGGVPDKVIADPNGDWSKKDYDDDCEKPRHSCKREDWSTTKLCSLLVAAAVLGLLYGSRCKKERHHKKCK